VDGVGDVGGVIRIHAGLRTGSWCVAAEKPDIVSSESCRKLPEKPRRTVGFKPPVKMTRPVMTLAPPEGASSNGPGAPGI